MGEVAITERGSRLERYTQTEVDEALRAFILGGGRYTATVELLSEAGMEVTADALRYWVQHAFATRYHSLREELGKDVGEQIAGAAMERATQMNEAETKVIQRIEEEAEEGAPKDLAALSTVSRNLAQAKSLNIEKAQLLRDKPTQIKETRSVAELLGVLQRAGVLKVEPKLVGPDFVAQAKAGDLPPEAEAVEILEDD